MLGLRLLLRGLLGSVLQKRLRALQAGIQTHNDHLVLRVPFANDSTLSA
jgi:hypothetical protein